MMNQQGKLLRVHTLESVQFISGLLDEVEALSTNYILRNIDAGLYRLQLEHPRSENWAQRVGRAMEQADRLLRYIQLERYEETERAYEQIEQGSISEDGMTVQLMYLANILRQFVRFMIPLRELQQPGVESRLIEQTRVGYQDSPSYLIYRHCMFSSLPHSNTCFWDHFGMMVVHRVRTGTMPLVRTEGSLLHQKLKPLTTLADIFDTSPNNLEPCAICQDKVIKIDVNVAIFDCCSHLLCVCCAERLLFRPLSKPSCPLCCRSIGAWTTSRLYLRDQRWRQRENQWHLLQLPGMEHRAQVEQDLARFPVELDMQRGLDQRMAHSIERLNKYSSTNQDRQPRPVDDGRDRVTSMHSVVYYIWLFSVFLIYCFQIYPKSTGRIMSQFQTCTSLLR